MRYHAAAAGGICVVFGGRAPGGRYLGSQPSRTIS